MERHDLTLPLCLNAESVCELILGGGVQINALMLCIVKNGIRIFFRPHGHAHCIAPMLLPQFLRSFLGYILDVGRHDECVSMKLLSCHRHLQDMPFVLSHDLRCGLPGPDTAFNLLFRRS
jgi:hypothetical protein